MRDADRVVDRVLKRLREVEAPAGMEGRILLAMKQRAATPVPAGWQARWSFAPIRGRVARGVALASLLCAVLWMAKPHRTAPRAKMEVLTASRPAPAQAVAIARFPPRISPQRLGKLNLLQVSALSESDALALAEMRAPSQPAPPLPLTEQEHLLMQVALRHDPEQLAVLNPETRAKQELQAKVEFQEFFEPVRPAEENPSTTTVKEKGDTQ